MFCKQRMYFTQYKNSTSDHLSEADIYEVISKTNYKLAINKKKKYGDPSTLVLSFSWFMWMHG
jgi:hypothetical protein